MRSPIPLILAALALASTPAARAGEAEAAKPKPQQGADGAQAPQPRKKPCTEAEHRQFDFWVGQWEVEADGKVAGTNAIASTLGGCVVHERWQGAGGLSGESFNFYDAQARAWRQLWVDNAGGHLDLKGGIRDGRMVLEGMTGPAEAQVTNRITWTPNPDGSVRQLWEVSKDGQTFKAIFDGLYKRKAP